MIASFDIGKRNFAFCCVGESGEIVLWRNEDLTGDGQDLQSIMIRMNRVLDSHRDTLDACSTVLIEQQMCFGRNTNPTAVKLAQNCMSWFLFQYAGFKRIVDFPAYHKTQVFGIRHLSKSERKKWTVTKTQELLLAAGDRENLEFLQSSRKRDDLADTYCQIQAWRILTNQSI